MEFKDYYAILGISRYSTADEIRTAYRTLSKKWHPDLNPGQDVSQKMQDINEAYAILKDSVKKGRYDNIIMILEKMSRIFLLGSTSCFIDDSLKSLNGNRNKRRNKSNSNIGNQYRSSYGWLKSPNVSAKIPQNEQIA